MTVTAIEKKAKLITGRNGRPVEVILPYNIYKETQESIKRAKEDIRHGRVKNFSDVKDAVKWLDK